MIYIFENKLGREQDHLTSLVQYVKRISSNAVVLCENEHKVGITTDYNTKLQADQLAHDYVTGQAVAFRRQLVTTNTDPLRSAAAVKTAFFQQVRDYREYTVTSSKDQTRSKIFRSCRLTSDLKPIRQKRDDLQMVVWNLWRGEKIFRENLVANSRREVSSKMYYRETDITPSVLMEMHKRQRLDVINSQATAPGYIDTLVGANILRQ